MEIVVVLRETAGTVGKTLKTRFMPWLSQIEFQQTLPVDDVAEGGGARLFNHPSIIDILQILGSS